MNAAPVIFYCDGVSVDSGGELARFPGPARLHRHPEYVGIAIDTNRFGFAIQLRIEEGGPIGRVERAD